jgi:hypothetical protein
MGYYLEELVIVGDTDRIHTSCLLASGAFDDFTCLVLSLLAGVIRGYLPGVASHPKAVYIHRLLGSGDQQSPKTPMACITGKTTKAPY